MKVKIESVSNGFVIKALNGEHKDEYVAQKEGRFSTDTLWARLFTEKSDAEIYAQGKNWNIEE